MIALLLGLLTAFPTPASTGVTGALPALLASPLHETRGMHDLQMHDMQEIQRLEARLSVVPVDFSTTGTTSGSGSVTAMVEEDVLSIEGSFSGTSAPATGAALHRGAPGQRGPEVAPLEVDRATEGHIEGEVQLTSELRDALERGHLYVLVRTEENPEGEIRGWLLPPDFPGSSDRTATREDDR